MRFNIVDELLGFTLIGAEWVLWLLVILSVLSITIMIERSIYFYKKSINFQGFTDKLIKHLNNGDLKKASLLAEGNSSIEGRILEIGLTNFEKSSINQTQGSMEGFLIGEKQKLDRGLIILGTLGNNAPFIGLFGTVIGIIKAFNDLANNPAGGPSVVMNGISEALVATAVGLLVAIPAVIAFNAFNRIVKLHLSNSQAIIKLLGTYKNH
jgi:biopolymer transport protein ExbB/TolQ